MLTNRESASTEPLVARPRWRQPISTVLTGESPARECGCPAQMRCVHFGERVLWLIDGRVRCSGPCRMNHTQQDDYLIRGPEIPLLDARCPDLVMPGQETIFPDLPSAEAEFDRRAAELRASG